MQSFGKGFVCPQLAKTVALGATALLLLAFFMAPAAAAAKVTLTFWHTYNTQSPEEKVLLEEVIPAFEKEHPDIRIQAQGIPYPDFHQKLITSVAGGIVPDVVRMDIIWTPEFARMGALVQVDRLPGFEAIAKGAFPGPLATCAWQGHYYGVPLDTNTQVILYNKKLFREAGIQEPPKTFAEFAEVARKLTKKDASGKTVQWGFALPGPWAWYFLPWVWSNGGAITDAKITRATGYLNGPRTVEALDFLINLYKEGVLAPTIAQSGLDSWTGLGQGKYAMTQDGPWAFPSLKAQYPNLEIGSFLFPAGAGGKSRSVVGGENLVIFKGSKHPKEAWEFARFMLSMKAQMEMATTGQMPVLKAAIQEPYMQNHPYYGIYLEQLKTALPRTPHPAWAKMEDTMQQAFQAAVAGKVSVKAAMDSAAEEIDGLLR
ncbi:MAG: extracellular solute-binding protein [Firmicutes bacterium]|nr:extracellular solute-binding protein [Bacillota bacterium]